MDKQSTPADSFLVRESTGELVVYVCCPSCSGVGIRVLQYGACVVAWPGSELTNDDTREHCTTCDESGAIQAVDLDTAPVFDANGPRHDETVGVIGGGWSPNHTDGFVPVTRLMGAAIGLAAFRAQYELGNEERAA